MTSTAINPLIIKKLEEKDLPPTTKNFVRDLLLFEKGKLDQEGSHYSSAYESLLNKYTLIEPEDES